MTEKKEEISFLLGHDGVKESNGRETQDRRNVVKALWAAHNLQTKRELEIEVTTLYRLEFPWLLDNNYSYFLDAVIHLIIFNSAANSCEGQKKLSDSWS